MDLDYYFSLHLLYRPIKKKTVKSHTMTGEVKGLI